MAEEKIATKVFSIHTPDGERFDFKVQQISENQLRVFEILDEDHPIIVTFRETDPVCTMNFQNETGIVKEIKSSELTNTNAKFQIIFGEIKLLLKERLDKAKAYNSLIEDVKDFVDFLPKIREI